MAYRLWIMALVGGLLTACAQPPAANAPLRAPRILAIFAHPDDETVVAPALAQAARRGAQVHLLLATRGDASAPQTDLVPGLAIAARRSDEARCAAAALGLAGIELLDFPDGQLGAPQPSGTKRLADLRAAIGAQIAASRPDVVITWGPDGGYGHPDHRLVGAVVGDWLARQEGPRPLLLHAAMRAGSLPDHPLIAAMGWATTAPDLIAFEQEVRPADLDAAGRAFACHASQYDAATRAALVPLFAQSVWRQGVAFRAALDPVHGTDLLALRR